MNCFPASSAALAQGSDFHLPHSHQCRLTLNICSKAVAIVVGLESVKLFTADFMLSLPIVSTTSLATFGSIVSSLSVNLTAAVANHIFIA